MKALQIIMKALAFALGLFAIIAIFGEPSDNTWKTFWACMAAKPVGIFAVAMAWFCGKLAHFFGVVARARHIAAIRQQQTTL